MPGLFKHLYRIRRFEETVLENFPKGIFTGTTHTYLGQEANAAGVIPHLEEQDIIVSNHRCHGHFLASGGDPRQLFAELMGKATGVCGGRGGSQHLCWKNFYSNGVQGGILPFAAGMAFAEKVKNSGAVTAAFLGDGTFGEGVLYEALNMSALWHLPILFVVENNQIAQTTPSEKALAGRIQDRFYAFGIPTVELDTSDAVEISLEAAALVGSIRQGNGPAALILNTCRFGPHSKGDDSRDPALVSEMKFARDPIVIYTARLEGTTSLEIQREIDAEISLAFQQALADPYPSIPF